MKRKVINKIKIAAVFTSVALLLILFMVIGYPRFSNQYSTTIYSGDGLLMGARIATDGQWRFPPGDSIPYRYKKSLLMYEDEYFYFHPGINPISVTRALWQNIRSHKVVSGGSTISMQVQRMSGGRSRRLTNKLIEMAGALGMELTHSKSSILNLYAAHAPYGGNVVGIEAAAWRYFGRPPHQLSWSECAMLAVLPNSPSLIHPGRNRDKLLLKRNNLLLKLKNNSIIDDVEYRLSIDEPLPDRMMPLPDIAPHLTDRLTGNQRGNRVITTIDYHLQQRCNNIVARYHSIYSLSEIHNMAAIIIDNSTGNVLAYVGNTPGTLAARGHSVDIVTAPRSTGSLLKPFLYLGALQEGVILPHMLLADIPTYYSDYKPENYSHGFDGVVPAGQALSRSLNVPLVRLQHEYGSEKLITILHNFGLKEINKPASHYGLSLILGGAESSLWSMAGAYASMSRLLTSSSETGVFAHEAHAHAPVVVQGEVIPPSDIDADIDVVALWYVMEALSGVKRPDDEMGWEQFGGTRKVAWKTGTSFGFRDAWAIGTTPKYTVGVWVGNAWGEGRPGIIGGQAAAPVMFELFRQLPPTGWYEPPYDHMVEVVVCRDSGFLAGIDCPNVDTLYVPQRCASAPVCKWHKLVHLSADEKFRVNSSCYPPEKIISKPWFILPPVYEYYYKNRNFGYQQLPPFMQGCSGVTDSPIDIIYPEESTKVFLGVGFNGTLQPLVVTATHRDGGARLYWYLDNNYLGSTKAIHQKEVYATRGHHTITITDDNGIRIERRFHCVGRGDE